MNADDIMILHKQINNCILKLQINHNFLIAVFQW